MLRLFKALLPVAMLLVINSFVTFGQLEVPVKWNYTIEKVDNTSLKLKLTGNVEPKWHLYAMDSPEEGSLPLLLGLDASDKIELIGPFRQITTPTEEFDDVFNVNIKYFDKVAIFEQVFKPINNEESSATLIIEGQACFDDGKCVLINDEIEVNIKPKQYFVNNEVKENHKDDNLTENKDDKFNTNEVEESDNEVKESDNEIAEEIIEEPNDVQKIDSSSDETIDNSNKENNNKGLLGTFFLAIILGLAGILTPCVFPMIPMTVSFFMQGQSSRASSIFKALFFGISIVLLYTLVGVIVSLTSAGADFPTLLSTHWIPNTIFFLLFIFFAGSFFGLYEIILPSGLANKADKQVDKGGILSSFFMAVTLVIVSFACTGPIVGALLVKAASGSIIEPTIGMLGFGLGFGIPFTVLAISPSWLKKLPQSGGWMNSVKVVMAFIILAFSLKFLSNMDQNYHLNLMSRDIYLSIWIVLFFLLGFYLLGKIKLPHDTELKHVSVFRLVLAIVSFVFAVYLIPGLFGAELKPVSGLIPPKATQQFTISSQTVSNNLAPEINKLCDEPKYNDFLHLDDGLNAYFDYEQGLKCAKIQNKPIMLYFTGHSCSNCKKMMSEVWTQEVKTLLNEEFVFIALYIDDKYKLPESEWVISKVDGKTKKTIGQINSDRQIELFNINSQPYYVILSPEETMINEAMEYNTDTEEFKNWINQGLESFDKTNKNYE
ncbi:MAG TPA: cytochrome c biogenesis protein CcdA [Bacteroidales bacterium]|nr:cytochrome c biogenesis protein CcdA [Bacteroidales bacterium]